MQLQNCVFTNFNLQILSSKSNLRSSFTNLFNFSFQKLVEKVRNYIKEVWLMFKKWVLRLDFEKVKAVYCSVKSSWKHYLKLILQNEPSKLRFSKLQSSNSIFSVQSPLFFYQLVQLQVFKNLLKKFTIT